MELNLYRAAERYPDITDVEFCFAESEEEAFKILEWYPKEEHGVVIEKLIAEKGHFIGYTISNIEIKRREIGVW